MSLKVFEAFAGIGCQSIALQNLGIDFEVVGISEVDRYALLAYDAIHNESYDIEIPSKEEMLEEFNKRHIAYNFSTNKSEIPKNINDITKLYKAHIRSKNFGDIRLIDTKELPKIDLFTYSYPCKNISVAGNMKGLDKDSGTQSSLVWECFKIIEHCRPKYLLMENVKNLVGKKFMSSFQLVLDELTKLGYNNYWKVLNGKDFGVPQHRERVMMVSIREDIDDGKFEMPIGKPIDKCVEDILEESVEDKYYVSDDMVKKFVPNDNFNNLYGVDRPLELGFIKKSEEGTKHQSNTVYDGKSISCTLCAGDYKSPKMFLIVEDNAFKIRRLTSLEYWRLQGLSDIHFKCARDIAKLSNTKLYERAGRAIVVPMLVEIFRNLLLNK